MALQPKDKAEFGEMLTRTAEMYGGKMQSTLLDLWWNVLADYDLAAVREGLTKHMRSPDSGQFMPKPADVIRHIGGTTQDAALQAWAKVFRAIRLVGGWMDVIFDDPVIHQVIADMGGWVALCGHKEDEMPFRAKEFENRYRGYARRPVQAVPRLTGRATQHNEANGYESDAPMLIGDMDACVRVMTLMQVAPEPNIRQLVHAAAPKQIQ